MTWDCTPDSQHRVAELLSFRYPEDPSYYDVASGRGICEELRAAGRKTAHVIYRVWGNSFTGKLHGYQIESINGQPFRDIDAGIGHSGRDGIGNSRRHPLESALK
jgi:hypothetical protein